MSKDYTYAVARIRGNELSLFSQSTIDQLMTCKTYDEALAFLSEKGWGYPDKKMTAEEILDAETEKTWALINELTDDMSAFDVFRIPNDYHNLKAAIKLAYTQSDLDHDRVFVTGGTIDPEVIARAARDRDFNPLPQKMAAAAADAQNTLLHTGDGQLCDIILDRASLEAVSEAGEKAEHEVLREYAQLTVAAADIKIAVRCGQVGKSLEFTLRALADCEGLNTQELAHAALGGTDSVAEYLSATDYASGADALRESPAAFERWCDNLITEHMQPQKFDSFTIGPLAAYILARQNEIKSVRVILSGKQNELPDEVIRERLREMYV